MQHECDVIHIVALGGGGSYLVTCPECQWNRSAGREIDARSLAEHHKAEMVVPTYRPRESHNWLIVKGCPCSRCRSGDDHPPTFDSTWAADQWAAVIRRHLVEDVIQGYSGGLDKDNYARMMAQRRGRI